VLITECKAELDKLREALTQDLAPRDTIEKLFVADLAHLVWEKRRLRDAKTAMWNTACKDAVLRIPAATDPHLAAKVKDFWLCDAGVREAVLERLDESGLDESAIVAEAMRWVAQDLERLDSTMASLEMRFRKVLRASADYGETFADRARMASNRLIEAAPVINLLENRRTKKAD
jgi:hypothetical protein